MVKKVSALSMWQHLRYFFQKGDVKKVIIRVKITLWIDIPT